jgi:hypothetical protein
VGVIENTEDETDVGNGTLIINNASDGYPSALSIEI